MKQFPHLLWLPCNASSLKANYQNLGFKKCKIYEIIKTHPNKTIYPSLTMAVAQSLAESLKYKTRNLSSKCYTTQNVQPSVGFQTEVNFTLDLKRQACKQARKFTLRSYREMLAKQGDYLSWSVGFLRI